VRHGRTALHLGAHPSSGMGANRTIVATLGESRSILLLTLAMCRLVRAERVDANDADGVAAGMKAEAEAAKARMEAERESIV
jgi:hypothetical protein